MEEHSKLTSHPVIGTLKGYDQLMNLVLDEVKEALTGMHRESFPLTKLIFCR
jgi:small nuclear ribonucleoprotein (snRNP)-like protein